MGHCRLLNAGPGGLLPVELWGDCWRSRHVWLGIWHCGPAWAQARWPGVTQGDWTICLWVSKT